MPRFDVTIAGEVNLDLILYGVPEELPRERELLADRMMLTLEDRPQFWRTISLLWAAVWVFRRASANDNFGEIARHPLQQNGVDASLVRRRHSAVTGIAVILQRERWRNLVTYAGTIALLAWDDLDFDYLTDSPIAGHQ
jgi:sugar/nucleoside kinase (ribokinase family)